MAIRAEYRGISTFGSEIISLVIETAEFGTAIARSVKPGTEPEHSGSCVCIEARGRGKSGLNTGDNWDYRVIASTILRGP